MNRFRSYKFTGAFFCTLFSLLIISCSFTNPIIPPQDSEHKEICLTGSYSITAPGTSLPRQYNVEDLSRSATAAIPGTIQYFVKAETPDDTPGGKLTVNVPGNDIDPDNKTFSINLQTGYYWTITVGIKDTSLSEEPVILSDSFGKNISATDTSIVHQFNLKPSITADGTGKIQLDIYLPSGTNLSITDEDNRFTDWDTNLTTISEIQKRLTIDSISSGLYVLKLKFQQSGKKPYIATQVISVYDNMKTNTWVSGGNGLITGSTFELSSTIYNASVNGQRNFYVDATATNGDTNGTGESLSPFKTVEKAIGVINAMQDTTANYYIFAKAGGSESTNAQFTLNRNINVIVYENRAGKGPANPSGYYDFSYTGTGFLFTVNKSFSITGLKLWGPNNTSDSVGVSMGTSTSVFTMNSGVITNFACGIIASGVLGGSGSVINLFGGSIINNGQSYAPGQLGGGIMLNYDANIGQESPVLNVKGAPVVADNVTYAAGTDRNIALTSGEIITVIGPLTQGCDLGVSIPALAGAGNGNARQITEGYQANNGSVAPSTYFHGDQYAIGRTSSTSEVFLGQSGGSYSTLNLETISIVRADTSAKYTKSKDEILDMNFQIMKEGDEVNTPLSVFDIIGYGSSFNNTAFYSTEARTGGGIKVSFKKDALPAGTYNLIVGFTDTDSGAKYDYSQKLVVTAPAEVGAKTFNGTAISGSSVFITGRNLSFRPLIVCEHEVTQKEYAKYCIYYGDYYNSNANKPVEKYGLGDNYPAYELNWYEAVMYCNLRSEAENLNPVYYLTDGNGNKITSVAAWKNVSGTNIAVRDGKYCYIGSAGSSNSKLDYKDTGSGDADGGIQFDETANGWRLPTRAEWEYLARAGNLSNAGTDFSGSSAAGDVAWNADNSAVNGVTKTHEVCTKAPNALGLYDMSGNVWEWCWDWSSTITAELSSTGSTSGTNRSLCGGGHKLTDDNMTSEQISSTNNCRVTCFVEKLPSNRREYIGFRVVRNAQ